MHITSNMHIELVWYKMNKVYIPYIIYRDGDDYEHFTTLGKNVYLDRMVAIDFLRKRTLDDHKDKNNGSIVRDKDLNKYPVCIESYTPVYKIHLEYDTVYGTEETDNYYIMEYNLV